MTAAANVSLVSHSGMADSPTINPIQIPPEHDPRLVDGAAHNASGLLSSAQRSGPHWCSNATPSCALSRAATGNA